MSHKSLLHCMLSLAAQCIVIAPVCLCVGVFVCGSVTTITRNSMHRSSPNWVCNRLNFGRPAPPGRGSGRGKKLWLCLTTASHSEYSVPGISFCRLNADMEMSAPLVSSIVNNAQFHSSPHINQMLKSFTSCTHLVESLLNYGRDFVVNWIAVRAVWQPQIWKFIGVTIIS